MEQRHRMDWPQDWASLRPYFEAGGSRVGGWTFDRYKSRVWIDFDANPDDLVQAAVDARAFSVIGATYYTGVYIGADPNVVISNHLRSTDNYAQTESPRVE